MSPAKIDPLQAQIDFLQIAITFNERTTYFLYFLCFVCVVWLMSILAATVVTAYQIYQDNQPHRAKYKGWPF